MKQSRKTITSRSSLFSLAALWLFLAAVIPQPARAADVFIIESSLLAPYQAVREAFEKELGATPIPHGQKSLHLASIESLVLTTQVGKETPLRDRVLRAEPVCIVTIGAEALAAASTIDSIPIIFLLAPNPPESTLRKKNITGILMEIPPDLELDAFLEKMPARKRIGLLFDPAKSADFLAGARKRAAERGVILTAGEVTSAKDVPARLEELGRDVEALWMIPDTTVVTGQNLKYFLQLSFSRKIPILTFSDKYLESGAAVAAGFDLDGMGREAAGLARGILAGQSSLPPPARVRSLKTTVNNDILKKLGIEDITR